MGDNSHCLGERPKTDTGGESWLQRSRGGEGIGNSSSFDSQFRLLAITQGLWGERIAGNIQANAPADWRVSAWTAPRVLPPIIDDPADYLPSNLPAADLILSLGEVAGVAQLLPDIVRLTGARAVIAPIDRTESLPLGLVGQLRGWLEAAGASVIFPRPFCTLTETQYNRTPNVEHYDDPLIRRFAAHFGRPEFEVQVAGGRIQQVTVVRDAACGCSRHVAEGLVNVQVDQAVEQAGMLHHHYPCLASMNQEPDYGDTLMHISGDCLRDAIKEEIRLHLSPTPYLRPAGRSQDDASDRSETGWNALS